jgi:flagellar hook-length control protein FliK
VIDTANLTVTANLGASEAIDISSLGESGVDLQLADLQEVNFEDILFLHLAEMGEDDTGAMPALLLTDQQTLPDGKELPLLPLSVLSEDTEQPLLAEVDPELQLEDESEEIIVGVPVMMSHQMETDTPLDNKLATLVKQVQKETQTARPTMTTPAMETSKAATPIADNAQADVLLSAAATDEPVIKADIASNTFEVPKANAQLSERSVETPAILSSGVNAKLAPTESANPATNTLKLAIDTPVQQPKWADNLSGRVAWMVMNNQQSAQISLNPAELGPIEVKVSLNNDQASVNFYAHNNTVRDAIEEAFPRLRDMLNENGLNLGQTSVSDQSLSQRQGHSEATGQEQSRYPFVEEGDAEESKLSEIVNIKLGLVDHFV